MLKFSALALVLVMIFGFGSQTYGQDDLPASKWSGDERSTILEGLKQSFGSTEPADCDTRCVRPVPTYDKIYCCVVCFGALYICRPPSAGSNERFCFCEVPTR
jgi:hypothetical protein